MISFFICLALLIGGYFVYGKVVENTFAPDDRETAPPYDYDLRSLHAGLLGGQDGYLCSLEEEMASIRDFMKNWR